MPYKNIQDRYKHQEKYRMRKRILYVEYLSTRSCVHCGETDIRTLDFHHPDSGMKSFSIGRAVNSSTRSWASILKEIDKCELICANCHRKHHASEYLWFTDIETFKVQLESQ